MKALVIGGTGPTGPFVVDGLLKRGYDVTIFHRGTHETDILTDVEHLHGDAHFKDTLNDTLGSRKFDIVIAMYGRLRYIAEVMRGRTERLICAGGVGVYKACLDPDVTLDNDSYLIPENSPLFDNAETDDPEKAPILHFTNLMVQSELAVMESHYLGFYNATILRFPIIYGPRQLIPGEWSIIRRILDGRKRLILPDSGLAIESKGYSENMAHGVLLSVDHPEESAGQAYNIADEDALSPRDWVKIISEYMDHKFEISYLPAKLCEPAIPYGMPIRPFVKKTGLLHHRVLDLKKIKTHLGYKDLFKAREGLKKTVQYYLDNPPEKGGETEQRLDDAFDYDSEDKLIEEYEKSVEKLSIIFTEKTWSHPYPHPDKPDVKRDQRGR
ncbi:MAG: epimerase [Spirochaetota bacterium]|nr:epimerase [Spirochaetota bacterium]